MLMVFKQVFDWLTWLRLPQLHKLSRKKMANGSLKINSIFCVCKKKLDN